MNGRISKLEILSYMNEGRPPRKVYNLHVWSETLVGWGHKRLYAIRI